MLEFIYFEHTHTSNQFKYKETDNYNELPTPYLFGSTVLQDFSKQFKLATKKSMKTLWNANFVNDLFVIRSKRKDI